MSDTVLPIQEAKHQFERSIRHELANLEASLRELFDRFDAVAEHGRGVNGLAAAARGWKKEAEVLADKIRDEGEQVSKALVGAGPERTESVNPAHTERVRQAKGEAA